MSAHTWWWLWWSRNNWAQRGTHDWNHHLKICRLFEASLVNTLPSFIQNILSSPIPLQQVILPRTHYVYQIWQQKKESVPRQSLSEAQDKSFTSSTIKMWTCFSWKSNLGPDKNSTIILLYYIWRACFSKKKNIFNDFWWRQNYY